MTKYTVCVYKELNLIHGMGRNRSFPEIITGKDDALQDWKGELWDARAKAKPACEAPYLHLALSDSPPEHSYERSKRGHTLRQPMEAHTKHRRGSWNEIHILGQEGAGRSPRCAPL